MYYITCVSTSLFLFRYNFLEMPTTKLYMTATHSHQQVSSNRVCALLDSDDDEGNHCSQKLNNGLELQIAEVSSIKDSHNEVLSWSENTKLLIASRQILRSPVNAPYVLQYQNPPILLMKCCKKIVGCEVRINADQ